MYTDKVSRCLCLSLITLITLITLGLVTTIALLEAQQPSNVPAVKATGAQSGVRREMAELKPDATFDVGGDPDWMAVSKNAVWVTISSKNEVRQLRAHDNTAGFTIKVKEPCSGLVAAYGSLWIPSCGSHNLVARFFEDRQNPEDHPNRAGRFRRRHHSGCRQHLDGQRRTTRANRSANQ